MNHTALQSLRIVLCAGMAFLTSAVAGSDIHPKGIHDVPEAKWEQDPIVFTARDRDAIRNYYGEAFSNRPSGPVKRDGDLPASQRRPLQRNGTLPLELQQRIEPLSRDLERRLHFLYSGYSRGMIGQDVLIVEDRTRRIMDIIRDVKRGR